MCVYYWWMDNTAALVFPLVDSSALTGLAVHFPNKATVVKISTVCISWSFKTEYMYFPFIPNSASSSSPTDIDSVSNVSILHLALLSWSYDWSLHSELATSNPDVPIRFLLFSDYLLQSQEICPKQMQTVHANIGQSIQGNASHD